MFSLMFSLQALPLPKSAKGTRQKEPAETQEAEADDAAKENAPLRKLMTAKKRKASLEQVTSSHRLKVLVALLRCL